MPKVKRPVQAYTRIMEVKPLRRGERRLSSPDRVLVTCRLCWRSIEWAAEHLEYGELHVYYRCPHCGGSFPVRHTDAAKMTGEQPVSPGGAAAS